MIDHPTPVVHCALRTWPSHLGVGPLLGATPGTTHEGFGGRFGCRARSRDTS